MQLSGPEILKQMRTPNSLNPDNKPNIVIQPFDERCLGTNSYDLHLSPTFKVYKNTLPYGMLPFIKYVPGKKFSMEDLFDPKLRSKCPSRDPYTRYLKGDPEYDFRNPKFLLDTSKSKETISFEIPETGAILNPQFGYLAATVEYTETYNLFPYIDGKSSLGRNFIVNHHTAGRGDNAFCGNWTLEIRVLHPTVVYPYMRFGQIYYEEFKGDRTNYGDIQTSHYNKQIDPTPGSPIPIDWFIKEAAQKQKQ